MPWYSMSNRTWSPSLTSSIMSAACAKSCNLLNHSGGPVIIVLVRRIVGTVKDRGTPIITGESNSVLDTVDQVLNLMSDHVQVILLRDMLKLSKTYRIIDEGSGKRDQVKPLLFHQPRSFVDRVVMVGHEQRRGSGELHESPKVEHWIITSW